MSSKLSVRLVKQKINDIDYEYDIIYNKIEKMLEDNSLDLGEKKINIFGLIDFSIDFIPDIIERKTIISVIVGILEELGYLEISIDNFRLKISMSQINKNILKNNKKTRKNNNDLKKFINKFYDSKLENKFQDINLDDKLFCYVITLILSIIEDSKFILLGHQFNIECVEKEENLQESTTDNIIINKILDKLKSK